MSRSNSPFVLEFEEQSEQEEPDYVKALCGFTAFKPSSFHRFAGAKPSAEYSPDWMLSVPGLIEKLGTALSDRKKQEMRFNLLEIVTKDLQARVQRLECAQTKIVPINTFAPEPYELLEPILIALHSIEGGFNSGWHDANIHSSGENEEEAVSNLKSLILDIFDTFSNEPVATLGPEPKRQLEVLKTFLRKKA